MFNGEVENCNGEGLCQSWIQVTSTAHSKDMMTQFSFWSQQLRSVQFSYRIYVSRSLI